MSRRTTSTLVVLVGLILAATSVVALTAVVGVDTTHGYSVLPNGRGGTNVEAAVYTKAMGFDKERSLAAFKETLYPLLRENCRGCHSTKNKLGSGAQAPVHADIDPNLAHEYALTRVNFREPAESKFVTRMSIDRHNCFAENCGIAAEKMLAAVTACATELPT